LEKYFGCEEEQVKAYAEAGGFILIFAMEIISG
jgi:hypothetical protein